MSRQVPFDESAVCDDCGKIGAFNFMGDFLCPECASEAINTTESRIIGQTADYDFLMTPPYIERDR